ncbi:GNAT family protein [Serinibacter arcticus]|uniref:GNAT family N-acetyltransferase n=1 Tax=Serinibacter arcticus TaxID=1655435 RepID=UPI0026940353
MWPTRLVEGDLVLRPLRRRDAKEWGRVRARNASWLAPWEATLPPGSPVSPLTFGQYVREVNRQARTGVSRPWVMEHAGAIVGQVTVSNITHGSLSSAAIGYWISRDVAGRGLTPLAVAMAVDDCFFSLGLHRVEINIRPENRASLRVVEKLGLRDEGLRRAYLHIQGSGPTIGPSHSRSGRHRRASSPSPGRWHGPRSARARLQTERSDAISGPVADTPGDLRRRVQPRTYRLPREFRRVRHCGGSHADPGLPRAVARATAPGGR